MENLNFNSIETNFNNINSQLYSIANNPLIYKSDDISGTSIHKIINDKISIVYAENTSLNSTEFNVNYKEECVVFYYQFLGEGRFDSMKNDCIILTSNEQTYSSNVHEEIQINLKPNSSCCIIQLHKDLVNCYLKELNNRWSIHFPSHNNTSPYHKHRFPITPPMRNCIEEILNSKREGMFLNLHLESLILKLLMLQFEQMENHDCNIFCSLKKSEVNQIYAARKIIISKLNQWITISELAVHVGTNEHTLKKGFKELFGTSIFEFIQNYKMEEAKKMLYNSKMNISNISENIGYKNVTHFSAAFKRKFGVSPSKLKSNY